VILSAGGTQREGPTHRRYRDAVAGGSLIGALERVALLPLEASRTVGPRELRSAFIQARLGGDDPTAPGVRRHSRQVPPPRCTSEAGAQLLG
jgi:hypothetical protein